MKQKRRKKELRIIYDIIPPTIKKGLVVVEEMEKKISIWTKAFYLFLKTSKYGLAVLVLGVALLGGTLIMGFSPKTEVAEIYPTRYEGDWQNMETGLTRELSEKAAVLEFSFDNSASAIKFEEEVKEDSLNNNALTPFEGESNKEEIEEFEDLKQEDPAQNIESAEKNETNLPAQEGSTQSMEQIEKTKIEIEEPTTLESLSIPKSPEENINLQEEQLPSSPSFESSNEEISFFKKTREMFFTFEANAEELIDFGSQDGYTQSNTSSVVARSINDAAILLKEQTDSQEGSTQSMELTEQSMEPTGSIEEEMIQVRDIEPTKDTKEDSGTQDPFPMEGEVGVVEEKFENYSGIILPDIDGNLFSETAEEDIKKEEVQTIFTKELNTVYSGFSIPENSEELKKIRIGFSFASFKDDDDEVIVSWSLDDGDWNTALELVLNKNYSNKNNDGYFYVDIFDLSNLDQNIILKREDIENIKIKFSYFSNNNEDNYAQLFLDAVWLETESEKFDEELETDEEKRIEILSYKNDFKINEDSEFHFKYKKKENGFLNSLVSLIEKIGFTDYWKDIKITAEIITPNGKTSEILSGEFGNFSEIVVLGKDGEISMKLKNNKKFKPGLYKIVLKIEEEGSVQTLEQDFTWGVLTINVNRSIYLPGEEAYIQMGVLRDDGHTICNANLVLSIKYQVSSTETILSAEDGTIKYSGECSGNNVTDVPDYFAYYTIGEAGIYEMKLTNLDNGYEISDIFEVRGAIPFEVERIGPTRIYPLADYEMVLKIKANEDFSGEIIETVPEGFVIANYESRIKNQESREFEIYNSNLIIEEKSDKSQLLIFQDVNLKIDDEFEIKYTFDAPNISPYVYVLGPLNIGSFSEARKWQIASDAVTGVKTAGSASGTNWTGTGNTTVFNDSNYASYDNTAQDYLILTNFGFTTADIPSGSTINGITVARIGNSSGANSTKREYKMALTKNASAVAGTEKAPLDLPKTTDDTVDIGSETDLWGTSWLEGDIVGNANFGVMIRDDDTGSDSLNFDYITVKITYSNHTMTQENFRIYQNENALKPTTAYSASENIRIGTIATNDIIRIRMNFSVSGENIAQNDHIFKLQFASDGTGAVPNCSAASGWTDIGAIGSTSVAWRGYNNTGVTDGTDLSVDPPTGGDLLLTDSTVAGDYVEENNSPTNPFEITTTDYAEYDWVVQNYSATAGTNYCFRMVESDGSVFETYSNYPNVATKNTIGAGYEQHQWASVDTAETVITAEDLTISDVWTNDTILMRLMMKDGGDITGASVKFKYYYNYADLNADTNGVWVLPAGTAVPEDLEYWEWYNASGCTSNWCDHGNTIITTKTTDHGPWVGKSFEQDVSQGDSYLYDSNSQGSGTGPENNFSLKYIGAEADTDYYFRAFFDDQPIAITSMHYGTNKNAMVSTYIAADLSAMPTITMPVANQDVVSIVKVEGTGVNGSSIDVEIHDHSDPTPVIGTASTTVSGGAWTVNMTYTEPAAGTVMYVHAWQTESGKPVSSPVDVAVYQREDYTIVQSTYGWFNNTDSTDVSTTLAAQDTNATLASDGIDFRLRLGAHIGSANVTASRLALKLQFAVQSGACDTSYTGESWSDVTASTAIAFNDNSIPTDGSALTDNTNDPVHPTSHTNTNQTYEELNNFTNTSGITSGDDGLWDFSLIDNTAPASTSYCFRIVRTDDTVIGTPVVVPEIATAGTGITISGYARQTDESTAITDASGTTITIEVEGGSTYTPTLDGSGYYEQTSVTIPSAGNAILAYIDNHGTYKGSTVTVANDTTSNITGLDVYQNRVIARSDKSATNITNQDFVDVNTADADDLYSISGTALTISSGYEFHIWTGKNYVPADILTTQGTTGHLHLDDSSTANFAANTATITGNVTIDTSATLTSPSSTLTISENYLNSGTFTHNSGTVDFDKGSATQTLNSGGTGAGKLFNNLTHSGAGTLQLLTNAIDVNGNFSQTAGIFDANSLSQNYAGNFSLSSGTTYTKGGTITFDGTTTYTDSTATPQNIGTVVASGTSVTLASSMTVDKMNVSAGTLGLASSGYTLELAGSGLAGSRPFIVSGTLNEGTNSTVKFTGTVATEIEDETYYNLELVSAGTPTYTLGTATSQTLTTGGYLIIGDGTNAVVVNADTYDPTLDVLGNFTISAAGVFTASGTGAFSIGGSWSNSATGTFTHSSGTVTFDDTAGGETISDGGDAFNNIIFNGSGGSWTYTDGASTAPNQTTVQNGTPTYLNAKTGTVSVAGGTLNVDWYLGIHSVEKETPANDIDTIGDNDITISENSGSPVATVWKYNSGWGSPAINQTTGTDSGGENNQPNNDEAIRIREYSKTSGATTYYLYNLDIAWQTNYGQYDYYDDHGDKYLTSTLNTSSGHDEIIDSSWYRSTPGTMNADGTLNDPPTNGSWYVGMLTSLDVTITGTTITFANLNSGNSFTDTASTQTQITVSTSATSGYIVTAWETQKMTHDDFPAVEIDNFNVNSGGDYGDYADPLSWTNNCSTAAPNNECGFGFTSDDTSVGGLNRYNGGTEYAGFSEISTSPIRVIDYPDPADAVSNFITYRISASNTERPGTYSTTIVYVVTAEY